MSLGRYLRAFHNYFQLLSIKGTGGVPKSYEWRFLVEPAVRRIFSHRFQIGDIHIIVTPAAKHDKYAISKQFEGR